MIKKILILTDVDPCLISVQLINLFSTGLKVVEFFPEITSEITNESPCIFAFMNEPPKEAMLFLEKNAKKRPLHFFCTEKAAANLSTEILLSIMGPMFITGDLPEIGVVMQIYDYLKFLIEKNRSEGNLAIPGTY